MKKKGIILVVVMVLCLLGGIIYDLTLGGESETKQVKRPEQGAGESQVSLSLDAGDLLEDYDYELSVAEQVPSEKEAEEYLDQAKKEILESAFGEQSAESVRQNLTLRDSYANGMVKAEWSFDPPQYVDENGQIYPEDIPDEGVLVTAKTSLKCAEIKEIYEFSFKIFAPEESPGEQLLSKVEEKLHTELQKEGENLSLPSKVNGISLQWKTKSENMTIKILFLELVILIGLYLRQREQKQNEQKRMEGELKADYPKLVSTMAILIGAGMTISQSWNKISAQYSKKRQKNQIKRSQGYELILESCQRMKSGETERVIYQQLGERAKMPEYRHLSRLLIQNFEKGTRGLVPLLEAESESAFEERKRRAMKLGEEAGTKMLFPMIAMLGLIMVIILVPAILNFSI